ncbi:kinesin-like protein KIF23 [Planococcus citri]|uniref:kinesin-like protein KIF23 n=1 Tax=Planococcus citri TaxID=170843 RepID=UPI0031F9B174
MKKAYTTPMKTPSRPKTKNTDTDANKESLRVYCRLKPLSQTEPSCIKVISDTSVQLSLQDANKSAKQYTFKKVFVENSTQKEVFEEVALPLVEQLIDGQNGLLFTYGVTGSGKTFTMTGSKRNVGIMPRCLDVLFNSIADYQARKFIFKPDKMNGFEVQTEEEAKRDEETYLRQNHKARLRKNNSQEDLLSARSEDSVRITVKEEDNAYAVFISYVEVYNKKVIDLLDNAFENGQRIEPKVIRHDGSGNGYVLGATEVEVKSTEEAFEVFYKGQKRKRMGCTTLNIDSSRSHTVFTIKLVQAPLNASGDRVIQDENLICVSQLSLVDLAGSERTNRTKNTGQRLNEAGKINQSLMVLRKCLETLRSNQQSGTAENISYREDKITFLFKSYFEGDGDIRMVVCVNPSMADADENAFVMTFAEATQDIIVNPTPLKATLYPALTPGRRRANVESRKVLQMLEEENENDPVAYVPFDANIIYNFGPFPQLESFSGDPEYSRALINYLEETLEKRKTYKSDLDKRNEKIRALLLQFQEELHRCKQDRDAANARSEHEMLKSKALEDKVVSLDTELTKYKRRNDELMEENKQIKRKMRKCEEKNSERNIKSSRREPSPSTTESAISCAQHTPISATKSTPRYNTRRTRHTPRDKWLVQQQTMVVALDTVLQPNMPKRKSCDTVTSPKKMRKTSKYCLMTQNQDETGDLETQLYKGDVVPTVGGGAQVIFNDVEILKQVSPLNSPTSPKQRPAPLYPDIQTKCSVAVEGRAYRRKR